MTLVSSPMNDAYIELVVRPEVRVGKLGKLGKLSRQLGLI